MLIAEGKTKRIWATNNSEEVLVESKDDITAGDRQKHMEFWTIPNDDVKKVVDDPRSLAEKMRSISLDLYGAAKEHALERGIIIADTKFEFGLVDGQLCLIDEILTPDSSRFWDKSDYEPGRTQKSFDKQARERLA